MWPWPESLDAIVAAPKHHTLLFENERVRVLDTRVTPTKVEPGKAVWYASLPPHSLENVGMTEIHVLTVELKDETN